MFSFTPILLAILLASNLDVATARPNHPLDRADMTPDPGSVLLRIQVDLLTITTVQPTTNQSGSTIAKRHAMPKIRNTTTPPGIGPRSTLAKRDAMPKANSSLLHNTTAPPSTGRIVDLTPADPTGGLCYPGGFQVPAAEDCQVLVNAQLYNSTGSLAAYPGTIVYVSYKTCAAVVQNLNPEAPQVQYNWAMLGKTTKNLFNTCLAGGSSNMGGALFFEKYLDLQFKGLYITLQRFDDSHLPAPQALDHKPKPVGAK